MSNIEKYNGEVLTLTYNIWVSGTILSNKKKQCINSIEIKETVEESDSAVIKIADPEFLFIDDNIFIEENPIKISMGWRGSTYRIVFNGYISAIDISFESSGIPYLTITCMDATHAMNRTKKSNSFSKCTSANVVQKIVQQYGYKFYTDTSYPFTVQETISQSNQTDINFIQKLANDEVHPFTARLVGDTFYYTKMGVLTTPKMTLTYKKYPHEIISFSPKINKETKQSSKSSAVDSSSKVTSTTDSKVESTNSAGASVQGTVSDGDTSTSKSSSGGYTYSPETKTWSKN